MFHKSSNDGKYRFPSATSASIVGYPRVSRIGVKISKENVNDRCDVRGHDVPAWRFPVGIPRILLKSARKHVSQKFQL